MKMKVKVKENEENRNAKSSFSGMNAVNVASEGLPPAKKGRPVKKRDITGAWVEKNQSGIHGDYAVFVHDRSRKIKDICVARLYARGVGEAAILRISAGVLEVVQNVLNVGGGAK